MKVELLRIDDAFHMEASNETDCKVSIDGSPAIGGHNKGARPMELLLMGLGGCSAIDIISILKKQRQPLEGFSILVDGERQADKVPSLFEKIHVTFNLTGALDEKKVKRAVDLSMETYCSVAKTLEKSAEITYSFTIAPAS